LACWIRTMWYKFFGQLKTELLLVEVQNGNHVTLDRSRTKCRTCGRRVRSRISLRRYWVEVQPSWKRGDLWVQSILIVDFQYPWWSGTREQGRIPRRHICYFPHLRRKRVVAGPWWDRRSDWLPTLGWSCTCPTRASCLGKVFCCPQIEEKYVFPRTLRGRMTGRYLSAAFIQLKQTWRDGQSNLPVN
jgi:hypothetical protein